MRFDLDTYKEIIDTIARNKSRSLLTGFGVFWGVFMLIALIGGGKGLKEILQDNFDGFAQNTTLLWAQQTTKPYKGLNKGRSWTMDLHDVDRLRLQIPQLDVITPMLFAGQKTAVFSDKKFSSNVQGVNPEYVRVNTPLIHYGRYINEMDVRQQRKVCVIGKKVYRNLFAEGGDPCGKSIRVDSTYYTVVGVDYRSGNGISIGGSADELITIPQSVLRAAYNRGNSVDVMAVTGRKGVVMSTISPRLRDVISRAHNVHPDDERGLALLNTELIFQIVNNLFRGVNILIWIVGIGTLLAGAIGVSNIMMVTVRERTTEIGIRRAIGATPRTILTQIMTESIILTIVAGMSGILFAVLILQMAEMAKTTDGIVTAHFQVDFWTALLSAILIGLLGALAGLAPAWRAMSIKPVDAMRDE